jgi:hypothetical protein
MSELTASLAALDAITLVARGILAFGAWVVVPLGLTVAVTSPEGPAARVSRVALRAWPFGALALTVSLVLPTSSLSLALALPWLVTAGLVALTGVARFVGRSAARFDLAELAIDAGLVYLPVGAAWACVARSNLDMLGFAGTKALLTANHFHYAGFGACVLVGALGRDRARTKLWNVAAAGTVSGVALVALGITVSHVIEVIAAWSLAACILVVAWLVGRAAREARATAPRVLLGISGLAGLVPAALAVHFSMTGFERLSDEAFRRMVLFHGLVNAAGFVGAGLLGLRLSRAPA